MTIESGGTETREDMGSGEHLRLAAKEATAVVFLKLIFKELFCRMIQKESSVLNERKLDCSSGDLTGKLCNFK